MNLWRILIVVLNYVVIAQSVRIKLTNVKCHEYDKPFATIPKCQLKIIKRGIAAMNIHVELHQVPVTIVSIHIELFKKANGYRPFLYNVTNDLCKVMKSSNRFSFAKIVLNVFLKDTNLNHSCPYNHDILVRNLVLEEYMFRLLPLPTGEYLVNMKFGAYNIWRALVQGYFTLTE